MPTTPPLLPRPLLRPASWLLLAITIVGAWFGWRELWHLADDAFITYRYLDNAMAGRGLVWNPAPFLPVDGNTDFLWSMLLLAVWKLTGLEPPAVANPLAFSLGALTLFALAFWAERLRLPAAAERHRPLLVALVLALAASNRAFLASTSSGLGMALFDLVLFLWCLGAARTGPDDRPRRWFATALAAAATGLARPEGHLAVAATVVLFVMLGWRRRRGLAAVAVLVATLPVAGHLVFRRLYYGDWLPCTYYAKNVAAWPESGVRFFASFVVEFGVWIWLAVALAWLVHSLRRGRLLAPLATKNLGTGAVVAVCLFHFGYYTFYMGGDLFEWRVYTHLVLLLPVSLVVMAGDLGSRLPVTASATMLVLGLPIPWLKYAVHDQDVAPHLPALLRPLLAPYDDWQRWLNQHIVCMRNHHMKVNFAELAAPLPTREVGSRIPFDGFPVYPAEAVGLVGWVFPNVAVIDVHGLNDWVVARTPVADAKQREAALTRQLEALFDWFDQDHDGRVTQGEFTPWWAARHPQLPPDEAAAGARTELQRFDADHDGIVSKAEYLAANSGGADRHHAHERLPPPGYIEGFRPNLDLADGRATVVPRSEPLTAEAIRAHEARFRAMVTNRR
ncbi:MAG: EF-hand domain-containing protein [Planctomycetes bacterium]|nr:EF-hand domain-containing protein [Planctomycetota bacterium]